MMKYLSLPVLLGLCVVVQAKSPQHTVNGITLNDSLAKVQQQLGKPTHQSMTAPNECNNDQPDMQLQYPGMLVTLSKGGNNQFSVSSIDISAPAALFQVCALVTAPPKSNGYLALATPATTSSFMMLPHNQVKPTNSPCMAAKSATSNSIRICVNTLTT